MPTKAFGPFRLPEEEIEAIKAQAQREHRTMTMLIRLALAEYIERARKLTHWERTINER